MPFLPPNQQRKSTEGTNDIQEMRLKSWFQSKKKYVNLQLCFLAPIVHGRERDIEQNDFGKPKHPRLADEMCSWQTGFSAVRCLSKLQQTLIVLHHYTA